LPKLTVPCTRGWHRLGGPLAGPGPELNNLNGLIVFSYLLLLWSEVFTESVLDNKFEVGTAIALENIGEVK